MKTIIFDDGYNLPVTDLVFIRKASTTQNPQASNYYIPALPIGTYPLYNLYDYVKVQGNNTFQVTGGVSYSGEFADITIKINNITLPTFRQRVSPYTNDGNRSNFALTFAYYVRNGKEYISPLLIGGSRRTAGISINQGSVQTNNDNSTFIIQNSPAQNSPASPEGVYLWAYESSGSSYVKFAALNENDTWSILESVNLLDYFKGTKLYPPIPDTAPKATFYFNKSDKQHVIKEIEPIVECNFIFKEPTNITNPVLKISGAEIVDQILTQSNYVYIDKLNRYYYITDMKIVRNNLLEITCKVDVLMSFKEQILQQKAIIERNAKEYNTYLDDSEFTFQANPIIKTKKFPNNPFLNSYGKIEPKYLLTIAGSRPKV